MSKKILVIDDEKMITKALKKLLEKNGYAVTVVNNGRDALAQVEGSDFNVIICDIRMPEMDGIETISSIREVFDKQNKPKLPEIIITGYADEGKYNQALDLKVAHYIYKPFDVDDILEAVNKVLGG